MTLCFFRNFVIVENVQFEAVTRRFRLSTAGLVCAKNSFFLSAKKCAMWFMSVDFPVPAEPYTKATREFSNIRVKASLFSSQSTPWLGSLNHALTEFE